VQAFNQKIENTYNIRGWLRMMNNPAEIGHNLFALDLRYENPTTSGAIATSGRFNGNISQMLWNSKTDKARAYGFDYDPLNRLTGARYGDGPGSSNNQNHFRTDFDYDANGNITNLQRNMDNTLIDDLDYTYYSNSNRLQSVTDASGNTAGYVPNTGQYLYDANGNMTYDPSKKINVSYNPLNLPRLVEFDNDDHITYTYTANGTKLRKTVTSWKTTTGGTTDYSGQFLYHDNELMAIFTPNGRLVPVQHNDETFWKHEYNLKDHLGNTRIVFAAHNHGQPEVMQQTSYYPFGMTLQQQNFGGALSQPNKLLYNGKELQDDELAGVSLDWYDYGARFYDPALGRWHSVDPLAEEREWLSPYNYVQNNPIMRIDPDGALDDGYRDMNNNYKWFDDETADVIGRDDKLWVKVTDDKNIFNMAAAGILDNVPEPTDPGQITEADNLTSFEMWLDSPSESAGEGLGKVGLNIVYGMVNAPYSLLTGQTIGGTTLTSPDKVDAFVDFAPGLITGGFTRTKEVIKTTKKGLQGYNMFVKRSPGITATEGLPEGIKWQTRAGQQFQSNKVNQQGLKKLDVGLKTITVGTKTKDELEK
jgi:RHS repeat-associated protein